MKRFLLPRIVMVSMLAVALCVPSISHAFFKGELDLTEEQIAALKELKVETRGKITPLVEELAELRVQLEEAILAAEINEDTVAELTEKIDATQSEIAAIVANAEVEASQILTPEQRELLLEIKEHYREKINEWKEIIKERRGQLKELLDFLR